MDDAVEVADEFLNVFNGTAVTFDACLGRDSGTMGINLACSFFLALSMALLNDANKLST